MPAETSQTLDRGLRVLEVLSDHPSGMTVTELAQALGVSRTIVYRLVVTLEQHGFLRRAHDGHRAAAAGANALTQWPAVLELAVCRMAAGACDLAIAAQPGVVEERTPERRRIGAQFMAVGRIHRARTLLRQSHGGNVRSFLGLEFCSPLNRFNVSGD